MIDVALRLAKGHQIVDANGRRQHVALYGVNNFRYVVPAEIMHRVGRDHPLHWFVRRVGMSLKDASWCASFSSVPDLASPPHSPPPATHLWTRLSGDIDLPTFDARHQFPSVLTAQ